MSKQNENSAFGRFLKAQKWFIHPFTLAHDLQYIKNKSSLTLWETLN